MTGMQLLQAPSLAGMVRRAPPSKWRESPTSGAAQSSGARIGAILGNGAVAPITTSAVKVLAACCLTLDGVDGTICATVPEIAGRAGVSARTTERAMAELVAAGLVHVHGKTRGIFRYVDEKVRKALQMSAGRRTGDAGWRELRARCGGFERAMQAAQRRERAAVALAASLSREQVPTDDATVFAHLRAEALHALACIDGPEGCDRCAQLEALLTDGEAGEAAEAARDRLEDADEVKAAAVAVVDAFAAGGVGARAQQMQALQTLERLVR
jgi:hypothetical protein